MIEQPLKNVPRIVLDTNCLLQILGARSKYHFLFSEFLAMLMAERNDSFMEKLKQISRIAAIF